MKTCERALDNETRLERQLLWHAVVKFGIDGTNARQLVFGAALAFHCLHGEEDASALSLAFLHPLECLCNSAMSMLREEPAIERALRQPPPAHFFTDTRCLFGARLIVVEGCEDEAIRLNVE